MPDKVTPPEVQPATGIAVGTPAPPPPRRPGHRGADVRDTVAEMAAKAQEISLEAGSKMAAAMKDVISAAAGLAGFAVESARDLVQYMVRRGQMTQDEADKLIREAEEANAKRKSPLPVPVRPPVAVKTSSPRPAPFTSGAASPSAAVVTPVFVPKPGLDRTTAGAATSKSATVKPGAARPASARPATSPVKKVSTSGSKAKTSGPASRGSVKPASRAPAKPAKSAKSVKLVKSAAKPARPGAAKKPASRKSVPKKSSGKR